MFLFVSLSPLMSRIFPESFPNKQYQLLFTQGSGESKEGERHATMRHRLESTCSSALRAVQGVATCPSAPIHTCMTMTLHLSAEIVNYEFDTKNLVCLLISSVVGVWYLLKKVSKDGVSINARAGVTTVAPHRGLGCEPPPQLMMS